MIDPRNEGDCLFYLNVSMKKTFKLSFQVSSINIQTPVCVQMCVSSFIFWWLMQKLCSGLGSSVGETITLKVFKWDLTFGLGKPFWGIIKMNWFQLR